MLQSSSVSSSSSKPSLWTSNSKIKNLQESTGDSGFSSGSSDSGSDHLDLCQSSTNRNFSSSLSESSVSSNDSERNFSNSRASAERANSTSPSNSFTNEQTKTSSIYYLCKCGSLFQSKNSVELHLLIERHSKRAKIEGDESFGYTIVDYRKPETDKYFNPFLGERCLTIRKSRIHGLGLYSCTFIPKGELIVEYSGEMYHSGRCLERQKLYQKYGIDNYFMRNSSGQHVDATIIGNCARYINNSCDPNCSTEMIDVLGTTRVFIKTLKDIYPGDELSFDYLFTSPELVPCLCKADNCKKYMNTIKDIESKEESTSEFSNETNRIRIKKNTVDKIREPSKKLPFEPSLSESVASNIKRNPRGTRWNIVPKSEPEEPSNRELDLTSKDPFLINSQIFK